MNEIEPPTVTLGALATELRTRIRILLAWAAWADIAIVDTRTGAVTAESADHLRILHALDRSGPPEAEPAPVHALVAHADIERHLVDVPRLQQERLAHPADPLDLTSRKPG